MAIKERQVALDGTETFLSSNGTINTLTGDQKVALAGGGNLLSSSRNNIASDNGSTWEMGASVTYTLDGTIALPAGVILIGPTTGSSTVAVSGSATVNGGTTAVTISAGQICVILPRVSSSVAFIAKVS